MKLELSGGTGESVPILGKVYFSKDGDDMKAIKGSIAYNIDENLAKIVPDEVDERETELPTASVDKTFNLFYTHSVFFSYFSPSISIFSQL